MSDREEYTKLLLGKGYGYPLWYPQPSDRPIEYRKHGVRVGDVGFVNDQGSFDYYFTVRVSREDERNSLLLSQTIADDTINDDNVRPWPNIFQPGECVSTESIRKTNFQVSAQAEVPAVVTLRSSIQIACSSEAGAALLVPNGASAKVLAPHNRFHDHAVAHGLAWLNFMKKWGQTDGLYLITACHKSSAWGITLSANRSQNQEIAMELVAREIAGGKLHYSWENSSNSKSSRAGPPPRAMEESKDENQCIFLREYLIVKKTEFLFRRKLEVKAIKGSGDGLESSADRTKTSSRSAETSKSSTKFTSGRSDFGGHSSQAESAVLVQQIPGTSGAYHPSKAIREQLFTKAPEASFGIVHDDQWMGVLRPDEVNKFPDDEEIIARVFQKFLVQVHSLQCAFLETPANLNSERVQLSMMAPEPLDHISADTEHGKLITKRREKLTRFHR
ncbi:hypothetical protein DFH09DRAFT_375436 [Mycena vulgaris]|nr:hypothetical protein DFH09DRAFT_375436 [Mycena vulgaris]